jgi:hypothetical protein
MWVRGAESPSWLAARCYITRSGEAHLRTILTVVVATLVSVSTAAQGPKVAVMSFQDTSCGAWSKSTGDEFTRAQYHSWFRGFVSGYNFGNPAQQVALGRMPDSDTLNLYVDKYCRENPLQPFTFAAFTLVREIRDK